MAILSKISKELIEFILDKENLTKNQLIEILSKESKDSGKNIPVSIFRTKLTPLEAITRYLKDNLNLKISEIAKQLHKNSSAVSLAYKNSLSKSFKISKTDLHIPLDEFEKYSDLSTLEIVSHYLQSKNLRLKEIAEILGRDSKTIWTLLNRAQKKLSQNA